MTSSEERRLPEGAPAFFTTQLNNAADIERALKRMAHEIIERNKSVVDVVVVGLQSGGVPFARRLGEILERQLPAEGAIAAREARIDLRGGRICQQTLDQSVLDTPSVRHFRVRDAHVIAADDACGIGKN